MATLTINGLRLHYLDTGSPDDPAAAAQHPLVLLHGLGCSSRDWDYQLPVFARSYRVIAPCLRGFGASEKPAGPYTIPGFARDLRGLLTALGVERCHLLGFSLGGAVAFQAAVDFPKLIASLVVANSQPSFDVRHWRDHLMKLYRIGLGSDRGMERMARLLARHCFPAPEQRELREEMLRRHQQNRRSAYLATIQALAGWSIMPRIADLMAPTLMISAELDYVTVPEREALAAQMPNTAFRVIRDSRHATPYDQPERFNDAVLEFLAAPDTHAAAPLAPPAAIHHMRSSGTG